MEELLLQAQGVKRRIRVITSDFYSMATALVGTELVATMHTRLALACARRLPIRVLPLPYALPPLAECLQWHRFQENDPCHIWLRGVMLEIARGLPTNAELPMAPFSFNAIETARSVA
jgi:DNA-binding transcriptional LysR family regulator